MPSRKIKPTKTEIHNHLSERWRFFALLFAVLVGILVLLELLLIGYWLFIPRDAHLKLVALDDLAVNTAKVSSQQTGSESSIEQNKNLLRNYKDNLQALLIRYKASNSEQEWQNIRNQIVDLKVPANLADYHFRLVSLFDLFLNSTGAKKESYKQSLDNFINNNWSRISYQSL